MPITRYAMTYPVPSLWQEDSMRRRQFIAVVTSATAWPFTSYAQQPLTIPRAIRRFDSPDGFTWVFADTPASDNEYPPEPMVYCLFTNEGS
jgi:hypothetical protein